MLNSVNIMGRLTADPELKHLPDGTAVCTARVAVDRDIKGKDGQRKTDFLTINAWKGAAEFLARNFRKGRMICVTGRLSSRDWTDQNGQKKYATEIQVASCYFADSKRDDAPPAEAAQSYYAPALPLADDDDYELPFE